MCMYAIAVVAVEAADDYCKNVHKNVVFSMALYALFITHESFILVSTFRKTLGKHSIYSGMLFHGCPL